jgi:hypothetical protein
LEWNLAIGNGFLPMGALGSKMKGNEHGLVYPRHKDHG